MRVWTTRPAGLGNSDAAPWGGGEPRRQGPGERQAGVGGSFSGPVFAARSNASIGGPDGPISGEGEPPGPPIVVSVVSPPGIELWRRASAAVLPNSASGYSLVWLRPIEQMGPGMKIGTLWSSKGLWIVIHGRGIAWENCVTTYQLPAMYKIH